MKKQNKFKSNLFKAIGLLSILLTALTFGIQSALAVGLGIGAYKATKFVVSQGMQFNGHVALTAIIDVSAISFNGKQLADLNEAIYEKVFLMPGITSIHDIHTGIKDKTDIGFLGRLGLVGKKKDDCETTANTGQITGTKKQWDVQYITDRFTECWAVQKNTFFIWASKDGIKKEDLTDTDYARFLEMRVSESVVECIFRFAHFGDLNEDTVANGGNIKNGTDIEYFNAFDGMWPQLWDIVTADSNRRATTITKNSGVSFAAQRFDATDTTNKVAELIFESLKYTADYRLRDSEGLIIICTQSLADQYAKELRSRNIDASYQRIEGGYNALMFEGIPVVPVSFWDRTIFSYFQNGTKSYLPHRAVLTTKANIPIGTESEGSLAELDAFYDKKSKSYNVDFGFNLDMKVLEPYMVQVAY